MDPDAAMIRIEANKIGIVARRIAEPVHVVQSPAAQAHPQTPYPARMPLVFGHFLAVRPIPANVAHLETIHFVLVAGRRADMAVLKKSPAAQIRMRLP